MAAEGHADKLEGLGSVWSHNLASPWLHHELHPFGHDALYRTRFSGQ